MSMQFTKRSTVASLYFNDANPGAAQSRITSADGPAGGEIRPEAFMNHRNSSGVTKNIGGDVPPKPRQ